MIVRGVTVSWGRLRHAYGWATDTPVHLGALEFGDAEACRAALDHLEAAVLHQCFPNTATAPAVRAVTALLADGRAHPDTVESLLEFLGDAAVRPDVSTVLERLGATAKPEHLPPENNDAQR